MSTVKKGMLTASGRWWKHLRWTKRFFWKAERQAARQLVRNETATDAGKHRKENTGNSADS
jgi:hypothetical protein